MKDFNLKIAFFSMNFLANSESWIWNQVKYIKPYLTFIGVQQETSDNYYKSIPLYNLIYPYKLLPLIYYKLKNKDKKKEQILRNVSKLEKKHDFNTFYIHYLTQAYDMQKILLKTKKKVFIHCHGYDVCWDLKSLKFPFTKIYDDKYSGFARKIQKKAIFIANSEFTKKNLLKIGIDSSRIRVLKFGVESHLCDKSPKKGLIKILYAGRLVDCKGPHLTISAFEKALKMGLNAELIIAGDGPLMTTVRLFRSRSVYKKNIKIVGEITNKQVKSLLKECHLFTLHNMKGELTNQIESYGVSILEAMSFGLPVVTGKSGGVKEIVIDGKTGYLFKPGDVEEHANKLYSLGTNMKLMKEMGDFSIKHVEKNFSPIIEEKNLLKILTE